MIGRISRSKETCPPDWARDGAETAATSMMGVRVYRANRREQLRMAVNLGTMLTLRHQPRKVHDARSIEINEIPQWPVQGMPSGERSYLVKGQDMRQVENRKPGQQTR